MTSERMQRVPNTDDRATQVASAVGSLSVGAAFLGLWFWLLPRWLGFQVNLAQLTWWQWCAAAVSTMGFSVALRCIWHFGWTGRGTPAPMAPPQRLVVVGPYRHVRNPMYLGFFAGWSGLWAMFGRADQAALTVPLVFVMAVAVFVRFYEEPVLRSKFGAEYEDYCRHVPRWVPRLRAWRQTQREH